jgi:hypothetical protein
MRSARKAPAKRLAVRPQTHNDDAYIPTAVSLPRSYWQLLRRVANARADRGQPGRRSVSRLIAELIDRHRRELEREAR